MEGQKPNGFNLEAPFTFRLETHEANPSVLSPASSGLMDIQSSSGNVIQFGIGIKDLPMQLIFGIALLGCLLLMQRV